jgi:predicted dehydrogenase
VGEKKKFSVTIIGLGSIGASKKMHLDRPENNQDILTHAHAIHYLDKHEGKFFIESGVDPSEDNKKIASSKWNIPLFFDSVGKYIENGIHSDVVTIATPTDTHLSVVSEIINCKNPSLIILEKPVGVHYFEAYEITRLTEKSKTPVLVNYSRMFCDELTSYKKKIDRGDFGKVLNVMVRSNRGFHDNCHAINLLSYLLGKFTDAKIIDPINAVVDRSKGDPTYPIYASFDKCKNVFFLPCDGRAAAIFTIDILFEKRRVVFEEYGQRILEYVAREDSVYGNYKTFKANPDREYLTSLNRNLLSLYENAYGFLTKGEPLKCTVEDAVEVYRIKNAYLYHLEKKDSPCLYTKNS